VLLHGWTATADLNWFRCYQALGERFRVLAFDLRGHGRGIRSRRSFRLEDCADDVADLADVLGLGQFIPVGYSMGGALAQLVWRRHPDRVAGLVLGATAPYFAGARNERRSFLGIAGLAALARLTPAQVRRRLTEQLYLQRKTAAWDPWAVQEAATHEWRMVLEAGRAIGSFSSSAWLGEIDVPVSVVITMRDRIVPVHRQLRLFEQIRTAEAFRFDGDHDAVIARDVRFAPLLVQACQSVVDRIDRATPADQAVL